MNSPSKNPDTSAEQDSGNAQSTGNTEKQVPLGPACLVVFVIGALILSVVLVAGAYLMMGNQSKMAENAIQENLIPWIQDSSLDPTDRTAILQELEGIVNDVRANKLNDRQLARLRIRIVDSPVFQWGVIQQIDKRIAGSQLTDQEKQAAKLESDRLLRCAAEGAISMEQLGFVVQKVASQDRMTGRLQILPETTEIDLREFLRRASALCDNAKIPREPYPHSPAQVFHRLIADAMTVPVVGK